MSVSHLFPLQLIAALVLVWIVFVAHLPAQAHDENYLAEMGLTAQSQERPTGADLLVLVERQHLYARTYLGQDPYLPMSSTSAEAIEAYRIGMEHLVNSRGRACLRQMDRAVRLDPDFFMCYAQRAMIATSWKAYDKAEAYVGQALAIDPAGLTPAEQILRKLMTQWKADPTASSQAVMAELVAAYPSTAEAYTIAGGAAKWIDDDAARAVVHYEAAQRLRPDYGPSYNSLAYCYLDLDQAAKAKQAFEAYLRLSPDEPNAYDSMGEYYLVMEDYPKSLESYQKAVEMGMAASQEQVEKVHALMKP